ncbi:hypothetical protein C6A85_10700, partial [Mycobacterium sp. ITM-2017-0098]
GNIPVSSEVALSIQQCSFESLKLGDRLGNVRVGCRSLALVIDNKYKDKKRQQQAAIDVIKTQLGQLRATIDVKYTALDQEI